MQIWKKVPFTDLFLEASNWGRIRDGETKKNIKIYTRGENGYRYFTSNVNEKPKTCYVHRCVLSAHGVVDGYEKLDVHHKDHNPSNNKLINLIWCTPRENLIYSLIDGRLEYSKQKASENARNQLKKGTHAFFNLTEEQHRLKYTNRSKNYKENNNHPNKGRFGLKGTNVKLTVELIKIIKERVANGEHKAKVAISLNLSRSTIYNVVNNLKKY